MTMEPSRDGLKSTEPFHRDPVSGAYIILAIDIYWWLGQAGHPDGEVDGTMLRWIAAAVFQSHGFDVREMVSTLPMFQMGWGVPASAEPKATAR